MYFKLEKKFHGDPQVFFFEGAWENLAVWPTLKEPYWDHWRKIKNWKNWGKLKIEKWGKLKIEKNVENHWKLMENSENYDQDRGKFKKNENAHGIWKNLQNL